MTKEVLNFFDRLSNLQDFYGKLVELLESERKAIIQADLSRLTELTEEKQIILNAIQFQENLKSEEFESLASAIRAENPPTTLGEFIGVLREKSEAEAVRLKQIHAGLLVLVKSAKQQNEYNGKLIQSYLGHLEAMKTNVLGDRPGRQDFYSSEGKVQSTGNSAPRIISREA